MAQHNDERHEGERPDGHRPRPDDSPARADGSGPAAGARGGADSPARLTGIVSGDYLLTVNPVDGSEIEFCPPGRIPPAPRKLARDERPGAGRAPADAAGTPLLERDDVRARLRRLLSQGRSVRLTGETGSGRTALLDAVAGDVAGLAPDGVVRLGGHGRTADELLYDLFTRTHEAPGHRPARPELLRALSGVGAVVVLDDLSFGGAALEEMLGATPECAWLMSATPRTPAPEAGSPVESVDLPGLSRTGGLALAEHMLGRPLTDAEADWVADQWFDCDGLPVHLVRAGALLRHRTERGLPLPAGAFRGAAAAGDAPEPAAGTPGGPDGPAGEQDGPAAVLLLAALSEAARETALLALALDGHLPHASHLPALVDDPHADDAVADLLACGLVTPSGDRHRLAAGVVDALAGAGHGTGTDARVRGAAQHYAWWAGQQAVGPDRVAAEADALLAAARGAHRAGHPAAAVLLARTAAPALAAAGAWEAWEALLRAGQEAARTSGEIAEEAYFHHERGVLALCAGDPQRAQAELEASLGLRGVLADQRGTVAGRRALTLAADALATGRAGAARAAAGPDTVDTVIAPRVDAAPGRAKTDGDTAALPVAGRPGGQDRDTRATPVPGAVDATAVTARATAGPGKDGGAAGRGAGSGPGRGRGGKAAPAAKAGSSRRRPAMSAAARRNLLAACTGALIAAVLGTVVTLGSLSGGEAGTAVEDQRPGHSDSPRDDGDTAVDRPTAPGEEETGTGAASDTPGPTSDAPTADDEDEDEPGSGSPTPGGDESSEDSGDDDKGDGGSTGGPSGGSSSSGGPGDSESPGGSGGPGGGSSEGGSGSPSSGGGSGSPSSGGGSGDPSSGGGSGSPSTGGGDGGSSEGGAGGPSSGGGSAGPGGGETDGGSGATPSVTASGPVPSSASAAGGSRTPAA